MFDEHGGAVEEGFNNVDGKDSENDNIKMNPRLFKRRRVFTGVFQEILRPSRAVRSKKCTKKCDGRAVLFFGY